MVLQQHIETLIVILRERPDRHVRESDKASFIRSQAIEKADKNVAADPGAVPKIGMTVAGGRLRTGDVDQHERLAFAEIYVDPGF
jgi:hypothetical protein